LLTEALIILEALRATSVTSAAVIFGSDKDINKLAAVVDCCLYFYFLTWCWKFSYLGRTIFSLMTRWIASTNRENWVAGKKYLQMHEE